MSVETTMKSNNPLTLFLTSRPAMVLLRFVIGGLFIFSAWSKVQNPEAFAIAIRGYKLLPLELTAIFALFVSWTELIAGVMLILGLFTRQAAAAIFLLLIMFTGAIATTIVRGIAVDCGCFSNEGGSQTTYPLIVRNLFLIAASVLIILFDRGFFSLSSLFSHRR